MLGAHTSAEYRALIKDTVSGPVVNVSTAADSVPGEFSMPLDTSAGLEQGLRDTLHTFFTRLACYATPGADESM